MKEKIKELIQHHTNSKNEISSMLEELNQIDNSKLSYQEIDSLEESKLKLLDELYFRSLFISDLENLL